MMTRTYPAFLRQAANEVAEAPEGMNGYLFRGRDGTQIVMWENPAGGKSPRHSHPFDEYACVLQGHWEGTLGDMASELGPGQECYIPAHTPHWGEHSGDYRAIDAWGGERVRYRNPKEGAAPGGKAAGVASAPAGSTSPIVKPSVKLARFPDFIRAAINRVAEAPEGMEGYLFLGQDGTQVVFWENTAGGGTSIHTHPFDEYTLVIQGSWEGTIAGEEVYLGPGAERHIPAGVLHGGVHSSNFRSIDAWAGPRVKYRQ